MPSLERCYIAWIATNEVDAVGPSIGLRGSPRVNSQWLLPTRGLEGIKFTEGTALILENLDILVEREGGCIWRSCLYCIYLILLQMYQKSRTSNANALLCS